MALKFMVTGLDLGLRYKSGSRRSGVERSAHSFLGSAELRGGLDGSEMALFHDDGRFFEPRGLSLSSMTQLAILTDSEQRRSHT
jgi:hypothetical protein